MTTHLLIDFSRAPWTDLLRRLGWRQRSCRFSMAYATSTSCPNGLVASRLLGGQCVITATLDERGHAVLLGRTPTLTFGELNGAPSKRIDAIATTMQDAGFTVRASNAVLLEMWEKWVLLATLAGMTCLMRGAVGDIVAAGAAGLMEALLEECRHIAASQDQMIRPDVLQRIRALLTEASSTLTASMLRDLERGTVTEADHILGDLLHRQSELAVTSPSLLRIAYLHLKTYEARRAREGSLRQAPDRSAAWGQPMRAPKASSSLPPMMPTFMRSDRLTQPVAEQTDTPG